MTVYESADEVHRAGDEFPPDHRVIWPLPLQDFGFTNFVVVKKMFTKAECADIIDLHKGSFPSRRDRVIKTIPEGHHHYNVSLLPADEGGSWVYERCAERVLEVNRAHWQYGITGMVEYMRTIHHVPGDVTDMHCDHTEIDLAKIAWSVCLQRPKKGGEFLLATFGAIKLKPGDAVFFPSMMGHGVRKVEEGERYQVVGWAAGPRFV